MPLVQSGRATRRLSAIVEGPHPFPAGGAPSPSTPQGASWGGRDVYDWARQTVEKVRVASVGGRLRFLPWYDPYTEETPEIRGEYRRMLVEPSIKAAFQTKVLSVISEEVNVSPDNDDDPREQEAAAFGKYALAHLMGGTRQVGWNVLHPAIVDGHSVCEKVWDERPLPRGRFRGKRIYHAIKAKDSHFLMMGIDSFRNVTAIKGTGFNAGRVWSPSDFVLFSYFSLFENPSGMSDFRAAYRPYFIKDTAWKLRSMHLENYTGPYLMGQHATPDQKAALELAFNEAKANTWLTVPTGVVVEAIDLSMKGTGDFKDAIADCDREILIAIVGAHLQILEGQTGGARGNTKIHKEIGELIQWWLAATLADVYQQQVIVPLIAENYHDVEPPLVTVGAITDEDMLQRTRVYEACQKIGLLLSKKSVYRSLNLQPPDPEDEGDVLAPPGGGGPGGPPGGGMPGGGNGAPPAGETGEGGGGEASPFAEWQSFCTEGENKGKPGPCPEARPGGAEGQQGGPGSDASPGKVAFRGASEEESREFNASLDRIGRSASDRGLDGPRLRDRIVSLYHDLRREYEEHPERFLSADVRGLYSYAANEAWNKAESEQRAAADAEFERLKKEQMTKAVSPPKKLGQSEARVQLVSRRSPAQVQQRIDQIFGRPGVTFQDIATLVGAPRDAVVSITPHRESGKLTVRIDHPEYRSRRTIYRTTAYNDAGEPVIHNDEFWVKPGAQGKGLGVEVFARQVEKAQELGVARIECHAAKTNPLNYARPHNGYYTWPRFGYDQSLESLGYYNPDKAAEIKRLFPQAKSVLDVMLTERGRDWWKANGVDLHNASFDLREGSRGLRVFHAYLEERAGRKGAGMHESFAGIDSPPAGAPPAGLVDWQADPLLLPEDEAALERAWARLGGGGEASPFAEFTEAEWAEFAAASAGRSVGEKWQGPSGKWFTKRQDGRVVPTAAPEGAPPAGKVAGGIAAGGKGKAAPPAPAPPAAASKAERDKAAAAAKDKAFAAAKAIATDPAKATPEQANAIGQALLSLNATDLGALKQQLGLKGGGRTKPAMVEAIKAEARRAVLAAQQKGKAPAVLPGPARAGAGGVKAISAGLAGTTALSSRSRAAFTAAAEKVTARMPDKVRQALDAGLGEVTFHESPDDLVKQLAQHPNPRVAAMFKNWQGSGVQGQYFPGAATGGKPAVAVARAKGKPPNTGRYDDRAGNQEEGALAHELTHELDRDYTHSNSPAWQKAFAAEIQPIDPKIKSGYRLSHYAASSRVEGFAEFGRLLYGSRVPPAEVEKAFPLASAYFKAQGLWPAGQATGHAESSDFALVLPEIFSGRVALPGATGAHVDLSYDT